MSIWNNILTRLSQTNLRTRLFTCLLLTAPLLIVVIFSTLLAYRALTERELARKDSMVELSARLIQQKLQETVNIGLSLAIRPRVIEQVQAGNWEGAIQTFEGIRETFPFIERIFIADPQAVIRADQDKLGNAVGTSRADTDWYKGVSKAWEPYICEVFKRASLPRMNVVDVAIPLRVLSSDTGVETPVLGILVLQIKLESFTLWSTALKLQPGEIFYIVDHKGHVVYHPGFPPQGDIIDFSGVPVVQELSKGKESGRMPSSYNAVEKTLRFSVYQRIDPFGWGVVLTEPVSTVFKERNQIIAGMGILYGVLFILIFLFVYVLLNLFGRYRELSVEMLDLYNHAPCGYHTLDKDGVFQRINDTALSWLGYSREDLIGKKNIADVMTPESKSRFLEHIFLLRAEGAVDHLELEMLHSKGTVVPVLISSTRVNDPSGKCLMIRSMWSDVRELRKAQVELKKTYADLMVLQTRMVHSEKMASLGQLAAGVAHEINNPVAFVLSNLTVLKDYGAQWEAWFREVESRHPEIFSDDNKKTASLAALLKDLPLLIDESIGGAERIKKIVQDLKGFAHPETTETVPGDINQCIESALGIVWNELKYKVEIDKQYGTLPQVSFNAPKMGQVFVNLFVNAGQAIKKHGKITVKTYAEDGKVYIEIADTGEGIPEELQSKIFDPFFTTKPVGQGTGLGLSIVDRIIRDHHGVIDVRSAPDLGTTFIIELPVR